MNKLRRILLISDAFYILAGALLGPIYALYVEEIGGDLLDASSCFIYGTDNLGFLGST